MQLNSEEIRSVASIDWRPLLERSFNPSPAAWEDQTFYLLLVDRFSDGNEQNYRSNSGEPVSTGTTPLLQRDEMSAQTDLSPECLAFWRKSGGTWCGGNLKGVTSKLGYLQRLGITTIWVSPILKQAAYSPDSYHGYGVQNFLKIDPHFGTTEDLQNLVKTAHELGMYVILDVVINHAGDVFAYADPQPESWSAEPYPVAGFRDAEGNSSLPFEQLIEDADSEAAIWPQELQSPECFSRKGPIRNWEAFPEYEDGDFFGLKDLQLGSYDDDNDFHPSEALITLTEVYKYWIAVADLDGLRLDTVKHITEGAVAYFVDQIHEFAESIGKLNFYVIGEIVGERTYATGKLNRTYIDAALGIGEVPEKIRQIIRGQQAPADYFQIFANTKQEQDNAPDSIWWRNRVVTFFDDHDQVGKEFKSRIAYDFGPEREQQERGIVRAVALQSLTLGIPCLYYGTEQGLDGHMPEHGDDPLLPIEQELEKQAGNGPLPQDQLVRTCLFGGAFGAFRTQGKHCFDEESWLYRQVAAILKLRQEHPALRRGRQYLREISEDGNTFWLPAPDKEGTYQGLIAWSRLLERTECVCVINTHPTEACTAYVSLDDVRHGQEQAPLQCLYSTDEQQIGQELLTRQSTDGIAVEITVPAGGTVVLC